MRKLSEIQAEIENATDVRRTAKPHQVAILDIKLEALRRERDSHPDSPSSGVGSDDFIENLFKKVNQGKK